jgi:hypothetical protein
VRPPLRAFLAITLVATPTGIAVADPGGGHGGGGAKPGHGGHKGPAAASFTPGLPLRDDAGDSTGGAEPSITVDSHDNVLVSAPTGVPTGGCPFWWVHPGSLNDKGLPYDYQGRIDTDHAGIGGGDCDISVTDNHDAANAAAFDDISVSSLSLANLTTNQSTDGGKTWQTPANPIGQEVFGVDRQWQASDRGLDLHYLTVHDLATTNIQTAVSVDGGYTYLQNTPAITPEFMPGAASLDNGNHFGALAVDPSSHKLYIPFIGAAQDEPGGGSEHVVYVAVGDPCAVSCEPGALPGPISWTDYVVYTGKPGERLSHDFPALSLDRGGNLYLAWAGDTGSSATNRVWLTHASVSDPSTWSAPTPVDTGLNHSNMFPWLVSGAAGTVDVAWYASTLTGSGADCRGNSGTADDSEGVNNNCHQDWRVAFAQSTDTGRTFSVTDVTGTSHRGSVCDQGLNCDLFGGDRTLLDFFDMDLDSAGGANIVYVDDSVTPGSAEIEYTRQCTGTSLTTGGSISRDCGPLAPTVASLPETTCDGTSTAPDRAGDAATVVGTTVGTDSVDIVDLGFADAGDHVDVTMTLVDLENTPPAGTTVQSYRASWTGPDGRPYGVEAELPVLLASGVAGPWDTATDQPASDADGNSLAEPVETTVATGPGGTITWSVPKTLIGSPTIPVAPGGTPAVGAPHAVTYLGEGSGDVTYVYWTVPADRAPNAGNGSSWSVC